MTEILRAVGLGPSFAGVPEATLEVARKRGSAVHQAIADHADGTLFGVDSELTPWMTAYERFLAESGHEPTASEILVTHPAWRYRGHIDRVGWLRGQRAIFDWKTADTLDLAPVAYQLAAYRCAWNAEHPAEPVAVTAAVQLRSDGTYRLHAIDAAAVEHVWLAAVTVFYAQQGGSDGCRGDRG